MSTLRGSSVGSVDSRRVVQALLIISLVTLVVLVVVFSLSGAHRNDQISKLKQHGVTVQMTVTHCDILIGGSGSNDAGHECTGAFTLQGHRYSEAIPGIARYTRGQSFPIEAVPGDPALLSPTHILASEHTSWTVFILPVILFVVLLLVGATLAATRRGKPASTPSASVA